MNPIPFPGHNAVYAKDQPEYLPLPAYRNKEETVSCWQLTWRERFAMFFSGTLWLRQLNFGHALQPLKPQVERPDCLPEAKP